MKRDKIIFNFCTQVALDYTKPNLLISRKVKFCHLTTLAFLAINYHSINEITIKYTVVEITEKRSYNGQHFLF